MSEVPLPFVGKRLWLVDAQLPTSTSSPLPPPPPLTRHRPCVAASVLLPSGFDFEHPRFSRLRVCFSSFSKVVSTYLGT